MTTKKLLKNKYVKEYGRLILLGMIAILIAVSFLVYHEVKLKAERKALAVKQASDTIITERNSASAAKAKEIFDWQIHYGTLYSFKLKQDSENITNSIIALGSNASFSSERAAAQPECINLEYDVSAAKDAPKAPTPLLASDYAVMVTDFSNAATLCESAFNNYSPDMMQQSGDALVRGANDIIKLGNDGSSLNKAMGN